jgi:uncharacterized protein YjdB
MVRNVGDVAATYTVSGLAQTVLIPDVTVTIPKRAAKRVRLVVDAVNAKAGSLPVEVTLKSAGLVRDSDSYDVQVANPDNARDAKQLQALLTLLAKPVAEIDDGTRLALAKSVTNSIAVAKPATVPVTAIKTSTKTVYLRKGTAVTIPVVAYGAGTAKTSVAWKSSAKRVATVTSSGAKAARKGKGSVGAALGVKTAVKVKGLKPGTAKLRLTSANGKKLTLTVKVVSKKKAVKRAKLGGKAKAKRLSVGGSARLTAKAVPARATGAVVVWKSSKPQVASIDAAGLVKAKARGKTVVRAVIGGKLAKVTVTVR